MLHGQRSQLIGQPHALDLLIRLDRASFSQQTGRVNDITCGRLERVEPRLRPGGRLAHHAIGGLGSLRQLQSDAASKIALLQELQRSIERPKCRRPRITIVVALEEPDVPCPRGAARVFFLRLDGYERRFAPRGKIAMS